ncbi:secretin N-terminal domain-containing protein [Candidatus Venteria ishoeyi]|uniref:Putative type II secretion system protein D n=1 Tax=Candidatus Venteria ishoeyi TaxID=1899563 RepID=A0A1H6F751_9GAMM|nr:secretin N-terminal domain-containing protein [Candidatus Venteria ishoeyi]SEH04805.1 Putative type II secretion system protein D precursor [Candidatus Venteria ishoeyi]
MKFKVYIYFLLSSLLLFFSSACTQQPQYEKIPTPLRQPLPDLAEVKAPVIRKKKVAKKPRSRFVPTPNVAGIKGSRVIGSTEASIPPINITTPVSISVDNLPLPAFINEVFANLLGLSFQIVPKLKRKKDLVTFRVPEAITPAQMFIQAKLVLQDYGIVIIEQDGFLKFDLSRQASSSEPPLIVTGTTLPEVPTSHRPIFQLVPISVVEPNQLRNWLKQIYPKQGLKISIDHVRNSLMLSGKPDNVRQALELIRFFDKPYMRSRYSLRINPVFIKAKELAEALVGIMGSQGYAVTTKAGPSAKGSTIIMPIESINSLIIFAPNQKILDYIRSWISALDQGKRTPKERLSLFSYPVKHTRAEALMEVLQPLLSQTLSESNTKNKKPGLAKARRTKIESQTQRLVVDKTRNVLIFQGKPSAWGRLLKIIKTLDKPVKQVLIEVIAAEVLLTDKEELGFEFLMKDVGLGSLGGTLGTLGSLGIGGSGLTYTLNSAGDTRAVLNAFASNSRLNLLSNPRLMVKSGESASISVGTDVPIVTSQQGSNTNSGSSNNILQEIQYRSTGILLRIKPVVHAGNKVDLEVSQEVSKAEENTISDISSPIITNRSIQTHLSLRDGGSVLLGGLIDVSRSYGESGIPVLKDIPGIGRLFRVDKVSETRSELLIMIVPYILNDNDEARAITEAFREQLHIETLVPKKDWRERLHEGMPGEIPGLSSGLNPDNTP